MPRPNISRKLVLLIHQGVSFFLHFYAIVTSLVDDWKCPTTFLQKWIPKLLKNVCICHYQSTCHIFVLVSRCIKLTCHMKSFRLKVLILMSGTANQLVGNVHFLTSCQNNFWEKIESMSCKVTECAQNRWTTVADVFLSLWKTTVIMLRAHFFLPICTKIPMFM